MTSFVTGVVEEIRGGNKASALDDGGEDVDFIEVIHLPHHPIFETVKPQKPTLSALLQRL